MQSDQTLLDLFIANAARDAQRYIAEQKFLEGVIKTLIGAIRTAPDLQSLRVVANESIERMRKRSLEAEQARINAERGGKAISTS
jgi:hypothetical protein